MPSPSPLHPPESVRRFTSLKVGVLLLFVLLLTLFGVQLDLHELSAPVDAVLDDLADLRLDTRWIGLPASLVGALHHRLRIFILAHRTLPNPTRDRLHTRRGDPRPSSSTARDDRVPASDN